MTPSLARVRSEKNCKHAKMVAQAHEDFVGHLCAIRRCTDWGEFSYRVDHPVMAENRTAYLLTVAARFRKEGFTTWPIYDCDGLEGIEVSW